jgi:hypothetical protein
VDPSGREIDEEDVERLKEHRLDGEEVAREHPLPPCARRNSVHVGPVRRGAGPEAAKDLTDPARANSDPSLRSSPLDPDAAPPRVLPSEACDQLDGLRTSLKFVSVITTTHPAGPLVGENDEIVGGAADAEASRPSTTSAETTAAAVAQSQVSFE